MSSSSSSLANELIFICSAMAVVGLFLLACMRGLARLTFKVFKVAVFLLLAVALCYACVQLYGSVVSWSESWTGDEDPSEVLRGAWDGAQQALEKMQYIHYVWQQGREMFDAWTTVAPYRS